MIKHNELVFGIPTQRSKKEEKYPNEAVLTMLAEGEKGTAKKIDINTYAVEQLEFKLDGNDKANFAFTMEGEEKAVYFANTSNIENPSNINVTKQATFSNKRMYEYLAKVFELDTTKDNEFLLSNIEAQTAKVTVLREVSNEEIDEEMAQAPTNVEEVATNGITDAQIVEEL